MDEAAKRAEVTRLLKRGLNHYGLGELEAAIRCWEKARELAPDNRAAQDYLETAYEESGRAQALPAAAEPDGPQTAPSSYEFAFDDDETPLTNEAPPPLPAGASLPELPIADDAPDTAVAWGGAQDGIAWGPNAAPLATVAPDDDAVVAIPVLGSSFRGPNGAAPPFVSWVQFRPDGIPVAIDNFCNSGRLGSGGGTIYMNTANRDYAITLSPLGGVRVHVWNPSAGGWTL